MVQTRIVHRRRREVVAFVRLDLDALESIAADLEDVGEVSIVIDGRLAGASVSAAMARHHDAPRELVISARVGSGDDRIVVSAGSSSRAGVEFSGDRAELVVAYTAVGDILRSCADSRVARLASVARAALFVYLGMAIVIAEIPGWNANADRLSVGLYWAVMALTWSNLIVAFMARSRARLPHGRQPWLGRRHDLILAAGTVIAAGIALFCAR